MTQSRPPQPWHTCAASLVTLPPTWYSSAVSWLLKLPCDPTEAYGLNSWLSTWIGKKLGALCTAQPICVT